MRRNLPMDGQNRERRQFNNVSNIRQEMVQLYWQLKEGRCTLSPGIVSNMVKLLDLIADLMMQTEAELRAAELEGKMAELAVLLAEQGRDVPEWALPGLKKELPN